MSARRLTLQEVADNNDCNTISDLLDEYGLESVVPACCSEECQVEPDGHCEHGFPSILVDLGII